MDGEALPPPGMLKVKSSLVHSAISMQVREATGNVVPVRRGLLGTVSTVTVHANVVQRVRSAKPVRVTGSQSRPSRPYNRLTKTSPRQSPAVDYIAVGTAAGTPHSQRLDRPNASHSLSPLAVQLLGWG